MARNAENGIDVVLFSLHENIYEVYNFFTTSVSSISGIA